MAKTTTGNAASPSAARLPLAEVESGWAPDTLRFLAASTLTFPEVFAERWRERPDSVAFHEVQWTASGDSEPRAQTYGHLAARAQRACQCLEAAGVTAGDRVLLCAQKPETFFAFFLAAQGLGAVPVPLPSAADAGIPAAFRERIAAVASDCGPRALVADDRRALDVVSATLGPEIALVDASRMDALDAAGPAPAAFSLSRSFDEIAFIQYTSGSTGKPKGVVVTHYNLVANMRASAAAGRFSAADCSVFWLPLYHDMGLIGGLLFGMYLGVPTYVMPPKSFVSRPDSWLRAISRWKCTFTIGPNFAYNLLSSRLPSAALSGLDLSSWRLAFNGAEAIDRATVEAFIARFEPYGFRATSFFPVYGMAETTLSTAFPVPGTRVGYDTVNREALAVSRTAVPVASDSAEGVTFVSVGTAMPGHRLTICDPDGPDELPERRVGEVVASGPSLSPYYFALGGAETPRTELRTGDLGYIADGNLYIVDRIKDLVIVAGRNLVPSDIERVAAGVKGVRYGAVIAFAKRGAGGTDELFVVAGIERDAMATGDTVRSEVRKRIQEYFGVTPREVALAEPRSIPKTSSGKLQRSACRQLYERGAFSEPPKAPPDAPPDAKE